ncbi:ScbR family autoregulator-binding transcription factor [Streptomyces sp. NPDC059814]|uniref:ScbR family autoregulator-binding transcription factor n=1 Tax=Streptomyces sp. NPDC059814 TaxID=3346959 RepID=UPI00366889C6
MVRQQRAVRSRKAILRAAARVVDRHGLTAATIARVSVEAGLSKGAIYFHFADKNALASALEQEAARALDKMAAARTCRPDPAPAPALTTMVETTRELARALTDDVVVRAGFQVSCDRAEGGEPVLRRRLSCLLVGLLEEARRDGSLAPGAAVDDIVVCVVAITVGIQMLARQRGAAPVNSRVLELFWRVTLPELAPGPPPTHQKPRTQDGEGSGPEGGSVTGDAPDNL